MLDETFQSTALTTEGVATLAGNIQGEVLLPGDTNFEFTRRVQVATDDIPALIIRAASVGDVVATVNFAREHHLELAVRSGGHSLAHYGTVDAGLVLDLAPLKAVEVDAAQQWARIQSGLTWEEVAQALQPHGLGLTSGDAPSVGVGGLLLGGGIGWFTRKYGLTIDRVRSIEVVTANGQIVTASATEHPDLFWAMRGGGGNFGVATSFEVNLHPAGMVYGGAIFHDARHAAEVLPAFVHYATEAPDELTATAILTKAPPMPFIPAQFHGQPVLILAMIYSGDLEEGSRVVAPLRALGTPLVDIVGPKPYPAIFELARDMARKHQRLFGRSVLVERVDDALVEALLAPGIDMPKAGAMLQLRILGGAMKRVPADTTAFALRNTEGMVFITANGYDAEDAEQHQAWVLRRYEAALPFAAGVYMNGLADGVQEEQRIGEAYPSETLERLRQIKRRYDPANLFHRNLNIAPSEG